MNGSLILYPHGLFLTDFEALMREAERQEDIHAANKGETAVALKIKVFYEQQVFRAIRLSDWVFESAEEFAEQYALDCFRQLKLSGKEVYEAQQRLVDINDRVTTFFAGSAIAGAAKKAGEVNLAKASDFYGLLELESLDEDAKAEAAKLREQALDQEDLQLWVTLRGIRDLYETNLPRVMYVVRRAVKFNEGSPPQPADSRLLGISETLDWYEQRINSSHLLAPVLGDLRRFYKLVRNVASHHEGLVWDSDSNAITLEDDTDRLVLGTNEFQQRFRFLVYFCEFGLRGILYAFCDREKGAVCDNLVREYAKTFPEDFPEGVPGRVRFYIQD